MKTTERERLIIQMEDYFKTTHLRTLEENDILCRELKMQSDAYIKKQNGTLRIV